MHWTMRAWALTGAIACLFAAGCGDEPASSERGASLDAVSSQVDPLARRYAPVVWIHRNERFGPTSVNEFLERSELTWRTASRFRPDQDLGGRRAVDPARLGSGCAELAAGCYRHQRFLTTDLTRPHHRDPARAAGLTSKEGFYLDPDDPVRKGETGTAAQVPIYYEIPPVAVTRIAYWFFFGYSRPNETIA